MNKEQYTAQRKSLLDAAQSLILEGKLDEANAKTKEIEAFDNSFDDAARAQANFNAMQDNHKITDISGIGAGNVIATFGKEVNMDNKSTQEYKEAFVKTLQGTATPAMKDTVTTTTGAAVIPTTTMNEIIQNIQKQQGILSKVRILQIPGNVSIPLSDINTPAAWHAEGTEIGDTSKEPSNLTLKGYELAKLFSMSAATQAMSVPAYESYLVQELQRTMGDALNDVLFTGVGTTQPTGLAALTYNTTNSVTSAAKVLTYENLVGALGKLASNFRQNAVWIMNSTTFYTYIATIKDLQSRPLFMNDMNAAPVMKLLGKEVVIDDFCQDNTIYLGDCQFYFLNISSPITVEMSREAGFTKGTIAYRSMCVVDGKPIPSGAFVKVAIPQA